MQSWDQLITDAYWPLVVIIAILLLRNKLKNLAFEYGDKKLTVELDQAEKLADRIDEKVRIDHVDGQQLQPGVQEAIDRTQDIVGPPREAISTMYATVRQALEAKIDDYEAEKHLGWPPRDLAAVLAHRRLIDPSVYDGVIGLQRLYTASMEEGVKVDDNSVTAFKRLATSIILGLESGM